MKHVELKDIPGTLSALGSAEQSDIISRRGVRGVRGDAAYANPLIESEREIVRRSRMAATESTPFELRETHGPALEMASPTSGSGLVGEPTARRNGRSLDGMTPEQIRALAVDFDDLDDPDHPANRNSNLLADAIRERRARFDEAARIREAGLRAARTYGGDAKAYCAGGESDPMTHKFAHDHGVTVPEAARLLSLDEGDAFRQAFGKVHKEQTALLDEHERARQALGEAERNLGVDHVLTKHARKAFDALEAKRLENYPTAKR